MKKGRFKDLSGLVSGHLKVVSFSHYDKHGGTVWLCKCDCGNNCFVKRYGLVSNKTTSCGHIRRGLSYYDKNRFHGLTNSPVYKIWKGMNTRCYNKNHIHYQDYGGKGISVCKRWELFKNFYDDIGHSYNKGLTLERINSSGNYEPENCKWADWVEQARNRKNNLYIIYNNKQLLLIELAELVGIKYSILYSRLKNGWDINEAIKMPIKSKNKHNLTEK